MIAHSRRLLLFALCLELPCCVESSVGIAIPSDGMGVEVAGGKTMRVDGYSVTLDGVAVAKVDPAGVGSESYVHYVGDDQGGTIEFNGEVLHTIDNE